jgi:lysyl-tRNA synthetase class 1
LSQTPEAVRGAFWADEEASHLPPDLPHVIRDSKTPSGSVPISGLRGPIITDALYRTFKKQKLAVRYVFTIDDYDPMDSASMKQQEGMREHMGKPLCTIPSPDPSASDFARYHAERYLATFAALGIRPEEIHWMRDLYGTGALDAQIDLVLRNAATIREIYARVANVIKDERWLPIGVICENCGRLGTTDAFDYDGKTVAYECRKDLVDWAEGCGHTGRRSPFKGGSKLYWNLQWCAMWDHFKVSYEEGGKDLLTEGGSRDRSNEIYRAVWKKEPPIGLIHEFLNVGGKKMSTSRPEEWKALGAEAHEFVKIYPPELIRFLMLRTPPHRHIDFDPTGDNLPRLVDEYDRCADAFIAEPDSDFAKTWSLSQIEENPRPLPFRVRFNIVAEWLQSGVDIDGESVRRKGAKLSEDEQIDLIKRAELAREWLRRWAPEDRRYEYQESLPQLKLKTNESEFLRQLIAYIGVTSDWQEMQSHIRLTARLCSVTEPDGNVGKRAYSLILLALLGRDSGPRAARVLTSLPPDLVRHRLEELSSR